MDSWPQDECVPKMPLNPDDLVQHGVITPKAMEFLEGCLVARLNVAISGPPDSGKSTLLWALLSLLTEDEEVLVVQNPDDPCLEGRRITTLRANLSLDRDGPGISRRYLLSLAPKMHPRGLVVDRVQGLEAVPLLRLLFAMDGIVFSIAADSPEDAVCNLEEMVLLTETRLDSSIVRRVLSQSLDLIIQVDRARDGGTKIVSLTEVVGVESDSLMLRNIFFLRTVDEGGTESVNLLVPTGIQPQFMDARRLSARRDVHPYRRKKEPPRTPESLPLIAAPCVEPHRLF